MQQANSGGCVCVCAWGGVGGQPQTSIIPCSTVIQFKHHWALAAELQQQQLDIVHCHTIPCPQQCLCELSRGGRNVNKHAGWINKLSESTGRRWYLNVPSLRCCHEHTSSEVLIISVNPRGRRQHKRRVFQWRQVETHQCVTQSINETDSWLRCYKFLRIYLILPAAANVSVSICNWKAMNG